MKLIVNEDFLDSLFDKISYSEAAAKENKNKDITLDSIANYIAKYRGKRGRKNKILQIIDDIDKLDDSLKSDAIKYAGAYLIQLKTSVDWTSEDIIAAIISDVELTKKFVEESKGKNEIGLKALGKEAALKYLELEKENHEFAKMLYASMKSGSHKMIHQLKEDKYKLITSSIIRTYKLSEALLKIFFNSTKDRTYQLLLKDLDDVIKSDTNDLYYTYINKLIDGLLKVSAAVINILKEDKPRGYEVKISEYKKLQSILQEISGNNYTLWPESEIVINSIEDLDKYFKEVDDYRKDAIKIIGNYVKRHKDLENKKPKEIVWDEESINKVIRMYIKDEEKGIYTMKGALAPHIRDVIELAEAILKENKGIAKFYKANDEDALNEVIANIAHKITRYVPFEIRFGLKD